MHSEQNLTTKLMPAEITSDRTCAEFKAEAKRKFCKCSVIRSSAICPTQNLDSYTVTDGKNIQRAESLTTSRCETTLLSGSRRSTFYSTVHISTFTPFFQAELQLVQGNTESLGSMKCTSVYALAKSEKKNTNLCARNVACPN